MLQGSRSETATLSTGWLGTWAVSDDNEPVLFTVVGPNGSPDGQPGQQETPSGQATDALLLEGDRARGDGLPFEERDDYLGSDRFPLAGPIVDDATTRQLKGRCSSCQSKLRIRVRQDGPMRVRCPICGHTRELDL